MIIKLNLIIEATKTQLFTIPMVNMKDSGQVTIISKSEFRLFWEDSLTKPPFGVTNWRFGRYNLPSASPFPPPKKCIKSRFPQPAGLNFFRKKNYPDLAKKKKQNTPEI